VCNVSGFGSTGPYADKKAYDLIVQSEVGILSVTGTESTPCKVGVSIADISAAMYAYSGILTALLARKDTGAGTVVDVSLFDSLGEWMGYPVYYTAYGGSQPERTGASHATIAPYGPFRTRDGAIVVAVHNDQEWLRFAADVLQQPHLGTDPRFLTTPLRFEHRQAMTAAIEAVFSELTSAEALQRLDTADIANARVNTVEEYLRHPQLEASGSWREIESPVGPLKALRPPARLHGVSRRWVRFPEVGQHSEVVLEELGFERPLISAVETKRPLLSTPALITLENARSTIAARALSIGTPQRRSFRPVDESATRIPCRRRTHVASLMRTHDWSRVPPRDRPESWATVRCAPSSLCCCSRASDVRGVGQGTSGFLYNDPYAEILGAKHPRALGIRFYDIWSEIWADISPLINAAMAGQATYREDLPLLMNRKGYDEQTSFTFSYSPGPRRERPGSRGCSVPAPRRRRKCSRCAGCAS
jgi:hypothetical protein